MHNTGYIFLIIAEVLLGILAVIAITYCDKRVMEIQKILERESEELIKLIKNLGKELIKLNLILDKFNEIRKTDWLKIITKVLDVINIIIILAPLGKKIPLYKNLFSVKSLKTFLSLAR